MVKKVLIIGAGIHGISIAKELGKRGDEIIIVDGNSDMLMGASFATHNRIHLGYHYPRSKETAEECRQGYDYFLKNYKDCLFFPNFYYAIDKKNSNVSAKQYCSAMLDNGLSCDSSFPEREFLNRDMVEDSFKAKEACFDIWKIKEKIKNEFKTMNIKEIYNFTIEDACILDGNFLKLRSKDQKELTLEVDLIINCTYTYSNNVQIAFSVYDDLKPYKFETTEIAVVYSDKKIPALTIMDGEFITILPYAGKENYYLVYDKKNSVLETDIAIKFEPKKKEYRTRWDKMLENGLKYFPFFKDLKYQYSLYGNRPISLKTTSDDRHTKIIKHKFPIDFYSILEGKFVSAPLIAERFTKMIDLKKKGKRKSALIGYTGFIGTNLSNNFIFDDLYNSRNISEIEGKEYETIISCGNSGVRWKVNKNPEEDLLRILEYIKQIKKVKAKKFILISTIDTFEKPINVYEDSPSGNLDGNPYGKHRLYLEDFVKKHFEDYLIVRLPIVYGHKFKKNIIYDLLNNKNIEGINTEAKVQVYNVKNLLKDINIAIKNKIKVLNIATEPIIVKEMFEKAFDKKLDNSPCKDFAYDMKSKYAKLFNQKGDYLYEKDEIIDDLRRFKKEYETMYI